MWSLQSFNENSERRKAARKARDEHALNMAVANRDVMGPAYTAKGRRKDLGLLKKNRPAPMTDSQGNPYRPLKRGDLGMTTRQENALGEYSATRGMTKRPQ
jgi:hypothetical protein